MNEQVRQFLSTFRRDPSASIKLRALFDAFRESLSPSEQKQWNRGRFLSEVAKEYAIGLDRCRVTLVVGLTDTPAPRLTVDQLGRVRTSA